MKNARNRMMAQIALFCGVFLVMVLFQANQFTALAEDTTAAATGDFAKGLGLPTLLWL